MQRYFIFLIVPFILGISTLAYAGSYQDVVNTTVYYQCTLNDQSPKSSYCRLTYITNQGKIPSRLIEGSTHFNFGNLEQGYGAGIVSCPPYALYGHVPSDSDIYPFDKEHSYTFTVRVEHAHLSQCSYDDYKDYYVPIFMMGGHKSPSSGNDRLSSCTIISGTVPKGIIRNPLTLIATDDDMIGCKVSPLVLAQSLAK